MADYARPARFPRAARTTADRGARCARPPDRPTARAEREPLPFRPTAAGCVYSLHVAAGQWGTCGGQPAVTGVWTSPRDRERWRVFGCAVHAARLADDPECRDVGPLDDEAAAELADRRERWQTALDGNGWCPPQPTEPGRRRGRLWRMTDLPPLPVLAALLRIDLDDPADPDDVAALADLLVRRELRDDVPPLPPRLHVLTTTRVSCAGATLAPLAVKTRSDEGRR